MTWPLLPAISHDRGNIWLIELFAENLVVCGGGGDVGGGWWLSIGQFCSVSRYKVNPENLPQSYPLDKTAHLVVISIRADFWLFSETLRIELL